MSDTTEIGCGVVGLAGFLLFIGWLGQPQEGDVCRVRATPFADQIFGGDRLPKCQALIETARDEARRAAETAADLRDQLASIQKELKLTSDLAITSYNAQEGLRKTVNHNAEINNKNQGRIDTKLGECGTEWVQGPTGYVLANKRCEYDTPIRK